MGFTNCFKDFIHNPFSGLFASPDPLGGNRILLLQRNTVIRPFSKIELRSREKKAEKTNQEEAAKPEKETSSSISGTV